MEKLLSLQVKIIYRHLLPSYGYNKQLAYSQKPYKYVVTITNPCNNNNKKKIQASFDDNTFTKEFLHNDESPQIEINIYTNKLSTDTKLCIFAYCKTWNDVGTNCICRCGVAHFSIKNALKNIIIDSGKQQLNSKQHHKEIEELQEFESEFAKEGRCKSTSNGYRLLKEGWIKLDYSINHLHLKK